MTFRKRIRRTIHPLQERSP